jgi:peptide deformylase
MHLSEKRNEPIKIVNPKVTFLSDEEELGTEGCLSFPGKEGEVWRCTKVRLTGLNEEGQEVEYEAEGLFARCIQHECDHLDGKLYVDVAEDLRPVDRDKAEDTVACAESAQAEGDGVKEEVAPEASVPDKSQAELAE